jgi:UDPglucose 6-dehydrogenase
MRIEEILLNALLLITEWPEFTSPDYRRIKKSMKRPLIIDARNFLDKKALTQAGFEYAGIGV